MAIGEYLLLVRKKKIANFAKYKKINPPPRETTHALTTIILVLEMIQMEFNQVISNLGGA